jgi:uncharacterized membrane protein YhhN
MSPQRAWWRQAVLIGASLAAVVTLILPVGAAEDAALAQLTRPLVAGLLGLFAATSRHVTSAVYRLLVSLGLLTSVVADVLFTRTTDPFLAGLAVSLVSVLLFFAAVAGRASLLRYKAGVVGYAAVATVVLALVVPVVGGAMRAALIAHVIALALTASQAASWMLEDLSARSARLAAFGMSCLVASHAVLVLDRFVFILPARDLLVLVPYWIALACLALSVERPPPPALRL